MTDTTSTTVTIAVERTDALVERLFEGTIASLEMLSIHLGRALGLYETLDDGRERTVAELATDAGIAPRYAREWLEQQAVAGLIDVDDPAADAADRRYRLAPEHARVLARREDPAYIAPFGTLLAGIGPALPDLVADFRVGAGVPFARYGESLREGQASINRPAFRDDLVTAWLPAVPEIQARLTSGARVADVGCGVGWSTQAVARAYPTTQVVGLDADEASMADARAALPAELADRVRFVAGDAATADAHGPFDVVLILEALHDMGQPVQTLASIRASLADGGSVFVADERVAETFVAPGDEIERMMFGWSVLHCLPAALADGGVDPTGTAIRPSDVRRFAEEAGFQRVDVLPIENDLFRFYHLIP